jgi:hypothetical protein
MPKEENIHDERILKIAEKIKQLRLKKDLPATSNLRGNTISIVCSIGE